MKAQDLKKSILQLAIQGKLVPQDTNDESAEVLYAKIQAEKQKLIKEGKIKKNKPLPPITDDEIPFSIPPSWKWVRLGDIGESRIGLTYHPEDVSDKGIIVLRSSNIQNSKLSFADIVRVNVDVPNNLLVSKGDIIICARNGSKALVGKSAIITDTNEPMTFGAFMAIYKSLVNEYVKIYLDSPLFKNTLDAVNTVTINQITQKNLNNAIIPLPPLAEQKRIVAKIEELEPFVKQYDKAETELSALNGSFPEQLKKSILQYAIQGKLVKQDTNDEPSEVLYAKIQAEKQKLIKEGKIKKDKPLPPITDDEIPFVIPSTWKWVRLSEIGSFFSGKTPKNDELMMQGKVPYFKVSDMNTEGNEIYMKYASLFLNPQAKYQTFPQNSIIFPKNGGAVFTNKKRILVTESLVDLNTGGYTPSTHLFFPYIYYLFLSIDFRKMYKGTALPTVDTDKLVAKLFPLPPFAEQHRIVAKVNELMQYCEKLKI